MNDAVSNAPQSQDETSKHSNESGDGNVRTNLSETKSPQPPHEKYHSRHGKKPPWWKRLTSWQFFFEILIFIVTVYIAHVYSGQLEAMLKANWINKQAADAARDAAIAAGKSADTSSEALISGQRAFVYNTSAIDRYGENGIRVSVGWENGGETPTQNMRMHVSFDRNVRTHVLPDSFSFPDIWQANEMHPRQQTISAKGKVPAGEVHFPKSVITKEGIYYYVWGWAKYNDVFRNTPEHVTHFCFELKQSVIPNNSIDIYSALDSNACANYNCTDGQCKQ